MRHVTCQHAGSTVDEPTSALFVAIERVTHSTPSCGGLRRAGARVCNRCGQARPAPSPVVGDVIMARLDASIGAVNKASAEESGASFAPDLFP